MTELCIEYSVCNIPNVSCFQRNNVYCKRITCKNYMYTQPHDNVMPTEQKRGFPLISFSLISHAYNEIMIVKWISFWHPLLLF